MPGTNSPYARAFDQAKNGRLSGIDGDWPFPLGVVGLRAGNPRRRTIDVVLRRCAGMGRLWALMGAYGRLWAL